MKASALDAALARSFTALSDYSAKNPIAGVDLSEYSSNLPGALYVVGKNLLTLHAFCQ